VLGVVKGPKHAIDRHFRLETGASKLTQILKSQYPSTFPMQKSVP